MAKTTITIKFNADTLRRLEEITNEVAATVLRAYGMDDSEYRKPTNSEGLMELDEQYESILAEIVKNVIK